MHQILRSFLDRLTERIVALAGSMVVSAVDAQRTTQQAEQQNALEELARQYEADGEEQIAAGIRRQLFSDHMESGSVADRLIESTVVESAVPRLERMSRDAPSETSRGKSRKGRRSQAELPAPLDLPPTPPTTNGAE